MNLNHTVKVVGSVLLSAVMAGSMMPVTVFAQNNDENPTEKTETVYSVLNSDGSISDTIVSSWLHDEDGINNIKETLNLKNVKNIKTSEKPSKDGNTYTWNVKGNDVYYEGDATQQLPVSVKIRYELDGQEVSAKDIDGKSGHLKLTISFTNNKSETKTINGKSIIIHPSFLAGGMLNMSTGNFTNVKCDAGKIVNDGSNEILAFANIPGLNETLTSAGLEKVNDQLGISDDVVVEADVNDFDLGSIMIGMTNEIDLSEELGSIDSVSELTDGIDQLMDADEQLIDGSKQLYDGTTQLKEQASPLTSASGQVRELSAGAIQLNDGVKSLQTGLTAYTGGVDALAVGSQQLYGITSGVSQIQTGVSGNLGQGKTNLLDGATQLNAGLAALEKEVNNLDENQLETMQKQIDGAYDSLDKMGGLLTKDVATLTELQGTLQEAVNTLNSLTDTETGQLTTKIDAVMTDIGALQAQINADKTIVDNHKNEVEEKIKSINNQIDTINKDIDAVVIKANTNISSAYNKAQENLNAAAENENLTDDQKTAIKNALSNLGNMPQVETSTEANGMKLSHVTIDNIQTFDAINTNQLTSDLGSLKEVITNIQTNLTDMNEKLVGAKKKILGENLDGQGGLAGDVQTAKNGLSQMSGLLSQYTTPGAKMNFKDLVTELKASAKQLHAGSTAILGGVQQVNAGLTKLQSSSKAGIDQVAQGTKTLSSNSSALNSGASQLSEATGTLAGQSGTFNEMADGLDTLGTAFETLNDGAKQLYDGNVQFKSEGLDQLKEKVDLGVGELETLQKVMDEIDSMNKEYSSYSGAPEGATVTSRYVFRTKEESSK